MHLKIEDIDFTDMSTNKEYNNSKTTEDLSAMADVTITDTNTENDMLSSGQNVVAYNPERSATGIDSGLDSQPVFCHPHIEAQCSLL